MTFYVECKIIASRLEHKPVVCCLVKQVVAEEVGLVPDIKGSSSLHD